jgi:hypothetical protein
MAERSRPDLVLDQHRGSAAAGIGADRFQHGERVAVAGVAIGSHSTLGAAEMTVSTASAISGKVKRSMSGIARRIAAMLEPETKPVRNPASSISRALHYPHPIRRKFEGWIEKLRVNTTGQAVRRGQRRARPMSA